MIDPYRDTPPIPSTSAPGTPVPPPVVDALLRDNNDDESDSSPDFELASPPFSPIAPLSADLAPPATPPPTPTIRPPEPSPPLMFQLTRSKLERAASAQISGRRGSHSLRELVLLSNVFSGVVSRPSTSAEDIRAREIELERRQKEDEAKWLDGVLEEMLLVDGDDLDDDEEEFVSVSFRDNRPIGDSGYLEMNVPPSPPPTPAELERIEEEADSEPAPRLMHGHDLVYPIDSGLEESGTCEQDVVKVESAMETCVCEEEEGPSIPNLPPLPTRSPPIDLALQPTRSSSYYSIPNDEDTSGSYLPALTPDSSPSQAPDMLGTSFDSLSSEDFDAYHQGETKRLGLLSIEWPHRSALTSESFKPISPTPTPPLIYSVQPSISPPSSSQSALALSLLDPPSLRLTTPSPKTSPPSSIADAPFPSLPTSSVSFSGIVKSFYDCVDFGGCPRAQLPVPSRSTTCDLVRRETESSDKDDLALVLAEPRPHPLFGGASTRHTSFGALDLASIPHVHRLPTPLPAMGSGAWRSRSMSPDRERRRRWTQLVED